MKHAEISPQRVVVVGQGYVGLPLAMAAVTAGFYVVGFDLNIERTKNLADGTSFTADVSDTELQAALDTRHRMQGRNVEYL